MPTPTTQPARLAPLHLRPLPAHPRRAQRPLPIAVAANLRHRTHPSLQPAPRRPHLPTSTRSKTPIRTSPTCYACTTIHRPHSRLPRRYQNLQSIIPALYQISADPILANPKLVTSAVKKPLVFPDAHHFLAIQFNSLQSAVLHVSTNPIASSPDAAQPPAPFVIFVAHITFAPAAAQRPMCVQQRFQLCPQSPPNPLPHDFLDPPDDCHLNVIVEPCESLLQYSAPQSQDAYPSAQQAIERHFPPPTNLPEATQLSKRPRASTNDNALQRVGTRTQPLWKAYTQMATMSRRHPILHDTVYKPFGGRDVPPIELVKLVANCTFLSTTGLNARSTIQNLCSQLGIDVSSPMFDASVQHFFDDDDVNKEPHAFVDNDQHSMPLLQVPAEPYQDVLAEDDAFNVIPFCDETDLQVLDVSNQVVANTTPSSHAAARDPPPCEAENFSIAAPADAADIQARQMSQPIAFNMSSAPPSLTHGNVTIPDSIAQHRSHSQSPKRQRCSYPALHLPLNISEHPMHRPCTPPKPKHDHDSWPYNAPPKVLVSPLYTFPSRRASSNSKNADTNVPNQSPSIGTNISSATTKGLESEHLTAQSLPQLDHTAPSASTTTNKSNTVWVCNQCGALIRGKRGNLNRHIAAKHHHIRNFHCREPNCGRKFQTRLNLVRHCREVHLGRPFACTDCPRTFKAEIDLKWHAQTAHVETSEKFECQVCGSCFGRRSTLHRHLTKVHKMRFEDA